MGTHWSEDEGGDWGSVGEALRAVWVAGSVGGGGGVANFGRPGRDNGEG